MKRLLTILLAFAFLTTVISVSLAQETPTTMKKKKGTKRGKKKNPTTKNEVAK